MTVAELVNLLTDCPLGATATVKMSEHADEMLCSEIDNVGVGSNLAGKPIVVLLPKNEIRLVSDN